MFNLILFLEQGEPCYSTCEYIYKDCIFYLFDLILTHVTDCPKRVKQISWWLWKKPILNETFNRKNWLSACWWSNKKLSPFWCVGVGAGGYVEILSNLILYYLTCFCTMYIYQLYMWSDILVWILSMASKYWGP